MDENEAWSVGQFLQVTNQILENAYPVVKVFGEISQLKVWRDRLVFFDLKDDESILNCMIPLSSLGEIEEGMEVTVVAQPKLTPKGKFSLNVRMISPKGEGAIKRQFDLLRAKLEKEGLFAPERKRYLPFPPKTIGLITAENSAAFADFTKIIDARWSGLEITLADVQVQGDVATRQVIAAINYFNQLAEPPEVLVITRGGGSAEDLRAFNDEQLTRAVVGSRIPSLVAIGHESDTSLAELVADVRASTPSNAAEILVPDKTNYFEWLIKTRQDLSKRLENLVNQKRSSISDTNARLNQQINQVFTDVNERLKTYRRLITLLNPDNALKNGYALIKKFGRPIARSVKLGVGEEVEVETYTQSLVAEIKSIQRRRNAEEK